jgi:hypothetical protein
VRFLLDRGANASLGDEEIAADALGRAREGEHEDVIALLSDR